jgi:hypothetical protein
MKEYLSITIAFIISPLTASIGFGLAFYIRWPNDFNKILESEGLFHLIGPNPYVSGSAYLLTLIFGLPMYILLRKLKLDNIYLIVSWALIIGGTFTYFVRFGSKEWDWEYGVFPALFVSLTAILILNIFKNVQRKI